VDPSVLEPPANIERLLIPMDVGHRQRWIDVRRFKECAKSLSSIEGVQQP
jgi:hypothetical protein